MPFIPFHQLARKIDVNYRSLTITDDTNILPKGEYGFVQTYCDDIKCDCRRAIILVFNNEKVLARIGYGWESFDFYKKWFRGSATRSEIMKYIGPCLHDDVVDTQYSHILLGEFSNCILDDGYRKRIKNNYRLFRLLLSNKN